MLLEGRRDEQSAYQARDIESKDVKDVETNKITTKQDNSQNNKHVGTVAVFILMKVVAQQQAKFAISVANLITLPIYVEAVRRNLRVLQGDQRRTGQ